MSYISSKEIIKILEGGWLFDRLLPHYKKALTEKLKPIEISPESPTTALTLKYYRNIDLGITEPNKSGKIRYIFKNSIFSDTALTYALSAINRNFQISEYSINCINKFDRILKLIQKEIPLLHKELTSNIDFLLFTDTEQFRSVSHPHFFGTILISDTQDDELTIISLAHELAHHELFLLNMVDRLVNSNADFNLVHAPYQGIARPPIGRLHSAHALFRMSQIAKALSHPNANRYQDLLVKTKETLFDNDELTNAARKIFGELYV